jgi:hypothetical protein
MYLYQLDCYERAVRTQCAHQQIGVINCYVNLGMQAAKTCKTAAEAKKTYFRIINTLEETMCDPLLSQQWRRHCLRMIKRLTPIIFELVGTKQYKQIVTKINTLAAYFLPPKKQQAAPNSGSENKLKPAPLDQAWRAKKICKTRNSVKK